MCYKATILTIALVLVICAVNSTEGSDRRTKYGCEGTTVDIECEEGRVINLVRANFGRFSISICNDMGNTTWSTNCIQPTTLRELKKRCGSKARCRIPVSSRLFGDPCPDTHKYVEVHYTCEPKLSPPTTSHAIPPWLLDLSATPAPRPAKPKTTTTTTVATTEKTTRPTTVSTTKLVPTVDNVIDSEDVEDEHDYTVGPREGLERTDLLVLESLLEHCPPVTTRNLFWNWTSSGDLAIQPCPGGSSGFAKWRCGSDSTWYLGSPDLSECQSHWLARLETRLRKGEPVVTLANELADLTSERTLYGGDLGMITQLLQSLAHRARQELFSTPSQEETERVTGSLAIATLSVGNALLEDKHMAAWADLQPVERAQVGSNLVLALQENAFFQAESINVEKKILTEESNLVSSMRIMRARDLADQHFVSSNGEVSISIPGTSLVENSENGAVRLVFFHYNNLDHVLPSSTNGVKFLNSHIASAAISQGHSSHLSSPLTATFGHVETSGMSGASCVWWDYVSRTWAEEGCWVLSSNASSTTCQCSHLGSMAVLMEEAGSNTFAAPHSTQASPSTLTVVIAAIVSIVICAVTVTATFIIFRRFSKGSLGCSSASVPCLEPGENGSPGYYPYLSSSATSTTITASTPDKVAASHSQYFLNNECQVLRPLMIAPIGPNSTIYRATFANGQQAHVIPIDSSCPEQQQQQQAQQGQQGAGQKYQFRPITPSASHIYMEIDPVYNSETMSDILVSDMSDDDLRRSSEDTNIGSERLQQQQQGSNRPTLTSASTMHPVRVRQAEEVATATQQLMAGTYNPRASHNWNWRGPQHHGHHVFQ